MNSLTDQQLLRDYAGKRSEEAFAELVRRHVDLVYSAALRMVRDAHLAEDVTQGAFLALDQSAAQLADRPVLSRWLHRAAQNLAVKAVRTDARRRAREQEAVAMNEVLSTEPDAAWEQVAPHLDAALDELSEADRDALLLRYFERKSAREMARTLGITDEAAQKRLTRAVERLREFFARRGITVGTSGLVVVISANAVQAAPVGIASAVATASFSAATATKGAPAIALKILLATTKAKIALAGVGLLVVTAAVIPLANRSDDSNDFQKLNARELAALETKIQEVYRGVAPSVVRIFEGDGEDTGSFSGVIIDSTGNVLTCAHHDLPAGTAVIVELADGSRVKGKMLGHFMKPARGSRVSDIGMMRLDNSRKWPVTTLGNSTNLKANDLCLAISYPNGHSKGQPPLLRLGRYIAETQEGRLRVSCRIEAGDSGGPLFDLQGRVIGVANSIGSAKWPQNHYARVEEFVRYRDRLLAGEDIQAERETPAMPGGKSEAPWGAFALDDDATQKMVGPARRVTVEVLANDTALALGLICQTDGWIMTKRSELAATNQLQCRLADGRTVDARVAGGSVEHDVALLKIEAVGLPAVEWGDDLHVGQIIASVGRGTETLHFGIVGQTSLRFPRMQGVLSIRDWETAAEGGARIKAMHPTAPEGGINNLLKTDAPVRTAEELASARNQREAGLAGVAGERAKLTVMRDRQRMDVFVPLSPAKPYFFSALVPISFRRSGFTNVFSHDGGAAHEQCGGPVVDRAGKIVGINIARSDSVQTLVLPAPVIRRTFDSLKEEATRGK